MSLLISANGTRRAPWDSRLGRLRHAPLMALRNVRQGAGAVPACAVTISRVYSLVYMESAEVEDAHGVVITSKTMRSAAAESAYAAAFNARAEEVRDGASALALEKAQREMDARRVLQSTGDVQDQRAAAAEQAALAAQVNFAVQAAMEEAGVMPRDVVAVLKLHVVGCGVPGSRHFGEALITGEKQQHSSLVIAWRLTRASRSLAPGRRHAEHTPRGCDVCCLEPKCRVQGHRPNDGCFECSSVTRQGPRRWPARAERHAQQVVEGSPGRWGSFWSGQRIYAAAVRASFGTWLIATCRCRNSRRRSAPRSRSRSCQPRWWCRGVQCCGVPSRRRRCRSNHCRR